MENQVSFNAQAGAWNIVPHHSTRWSVPATQKVSSAFSFKFLGFLTVSLTLIIFTSPHGSSPSGGSTSLYPFFASRLSSF